MMLVCLKCQPSGLWGSAEDVVFLYDEKHMPPKRHPNNFMKLLQNSMLALFTNMDQPPLPFVLDDSRKSRWDKRVKVTFQPQAWCDENIMKKWVSEDWNSMFLNPPTPGSSGKILFADVHTAQQTDGVKTLLN